MSFPKRAPGLPPVWNARRSIVCAGLIAVGSGQTLGAIALSTSSAALLNGEPVAFGIPVLAALLITTCVSLCLFVIQSRTAERFALSYVHDVRMAYARHVLLLPFDGRSPGIGLSLTRMVNDLGAIKLWLSRGLLALVTLVPTLATIAAWIVLAEPTFILPLAVGLAVWALGILSAMPSLRQSIRLARKKRGGIALLVGRVLPDRLPLLMHGKLTPVLQRLSKKSVDACRHLTARATWSGVMRAVSRATFPCAVAVFALSGGADGGAIALFLLVFAFLSAQLEAGAAGLEYFEANRVARAKLSGVFSLKPLAPFGDRTEAAPNWRESIEITSLELPSGKVFSAQIPAGVTTRLQLAEAQDLNHLALSLCGLTLDASQERICLDGIAFADLDQKTLWRGIALVSPLNGFPTYQTKRAAVSLGARTGATEAELASLERLFGVETGPVPDTARNLPEADRVRLRLARAFLRKPHVLVLHDDALLADEDLVANLTRLAEEKGTTLVLLSRRSPS
ncbi:hypothetical protein [Roseibium sp. MMSF_3544]|uniref:hypothetical protein n=1 Tax=unclassified Roseibium TaxID=2629323 RepID=UPI00273FDC22|nr:hypothetical protein [Roseibium sp. MMSF_3544]